MLKLQGHYFLKVIGIAGIKRKNWEFLRSKIDVTSFTFYNQSAIFYNHLVFKYLLGYSILSEICPFVFINLLGPPFIFNIFFILVSGLGWHR